MREAHTDALPSPSNDTWRAWLMTGVRRQQGDKRRIRGAHLGLKRMLVEGMKVHLDRPYSWKEFSDALVRQAVGDAVGSLPRQDAELVKLAYFGGLSNREIATTTGVPQATIERRLRRAIESIAEFVERGRGLGQRALGALAVWLSGRWFHDSVLPAAQATAVAGIAAVIAVQAPPPANPAVPAAPVVAAAPAAPAAQSHRAIPAPAATQPAGQSQPDASDPAAGQAPASVQVPVTNVPVPVNIPVPTPPLPPLPVKIKPPQL